MARKQKKLTRKQRTQQQQTKISQRRAEKGWISPEERSKQHNELAEDMIPFFSSLKNKTKLEEEEELYWLLIESDDLADEPEFKGILAEPLIAALTYIKVAEEQGIATPDMLDKLPEEEREDKKAKILEETTRRLFKDELRQEIIEAIDLLRLRWKKEEQQLDVAQAAAIQMILNKRKSAKIWPALGLIQAIVLRSMDAGFELLDASMEDDVEPEDEPTDDILTIFYKKLNDPDIAQKLDQIIKQSPDLDAYFEKQADKSWNLGEEAVFMGQLNLGLFMDEEIEAGWKIFKTVITEPIANAPMDVIEARNEALYTQLDAYLTERFTPERWEQLQARLEAVLSDEVGYPSQYSSFLEMLTVAMANEKAPENEKEFLMIALLGEMKAAATDE